MIDFITVSNDAARLAALEKSIGCMMGSCAIPASAASQDARTWRLTAVDGDTHDIFKGYNAGAAQTKGDVLAFLHHDVALLANATALERPLNLLSNPAVGFIGVAGATRLNAAGTWWGDLPQAQVMAHCRGLVGCPDKANPHNPFGMSFLSWPGSAMFGRVLVVDGVFLMCHRRTFERLGGFDDKTFSGFHFYDIDVTLRAHFAGLANFVAPIPMFHDSTGNYDQVWEAARQVFIRKFAGRIPLSL